MILDKLGNGIGDELGFSMEYETQKVIKAIEFKISSRDKKIIREIARRIAELAARDEEDEKRILWYKHNDMERTRPLIFCDPENGWYEIITPDKLKCKGNLARIWEFKLRKEIFWGECIKDDRVVEPYFTVNYVFEETDRGLSATFYGRQGSGSYRWVAPIKDYNDFDKLSPARIIVDYERTKELYNLAFEVMGDILEIRLRGAWWWSLGRTWNIVELRGLGQFMMDFGQLS